MSPTTKAQELNSRPLKIKKIFNVSSLLAITAVLAFSCNTGNDLELAEKQQYRKAPLMYQEFVMTRDLSTNTVPKQRLVEAARLVENNSMTVRTASLTWEERGPSNIGGRSRTILVDATDATGNTVFAGSVSGGLFKTTNFLSANPNWAPVNDFLPNLAITALVQDPTVPAVMYAGTGEGYFNVDAVRGAGIFKSIDGGTTWNQIPTTAAFEYVQDMVITNDGKIFASLRNQATTFRGIMMSNDFGATWVQVAGMPLAGFNTGRAADLEVASNGDLYATLGLFSPTQVIKSSFATHGVNTGNAGTWVDITPPHVRETYRGEIAVAPSDPQRLYVLMQDAETDQVLSIWRSSNGGSNWDSLGAPGALNNGAASQTWFNMIAAVDPSNADVLIVGGLNLAKTTNAGTTWTTISTSANVHVDQHELIFMANNKLIVGNDGGIFYTTDVSQAAPVFQNKNSGYNVTQFYGADFHPTLTNYFLAGAQDNNTQRFSSAGVNTTVPVVGGDGGFPHIDKTDGQIQIASTTGNNFFRSLDGGTTFNYLSGVSNSRGQFINPTDYDSELNNLYAGDNAGRYFVVSNLGGTPAGSIVTVSQMGARSLTAVKVDPFINNCIWVGASLGNSIPMVLKLTNANTTTPVVQLSSQLPVPANAYISSVDVDPANGNHILVTLSNYGVTSVFESTNGGINWTSLEGNLPDMPVRWGLFAPATAELDGQNAGGVILATEMGVWTTSQINGPATQWVANNNGLANVRVDQLKYRSSDAMLLAATHGRGLYTTTLPGVVTGVAPGVITEGFIRYVSADANNLLLVKGNLTGVTKMKVDVFNAAGSLVYSREQAYQNANINIAALPSGNYTVRIRGNRNEYFVRQFVK